MTEIQTIRRASDIRPHVTDGIRKAIDYWIERYHDASGIGLMYATRQARQELDKIVEANPVAVDMVAAKERKQQQQWQQFDD